MTQPNLKPDEIAMLERAEKATSEDRDDDFSAHMLAKHVSALDVKPIITRLANERAKLAIAMEALRGIEEYWNRNPNERAMQDACDHAVETASTALARINELEKQP